MPRRRSAASVNGFKVLTTGAELGIPNHSRPSLQCKTQAQAACMDLSLPKTSGHLQWRPQPWEPLRGAPDPAGKPRTEAFACGFSRSPCR